MPINKIRCHADGDFSDNIVAGRDQDRYLGNRPVLLDNLNNVLKFALFGQA